MSDETIPRLYLLFLGEAPSNLWAKTAAGIAHWRPDWCAGQISLPGCGADCGLEALTLEAAAARGTKTLVIGVAPAGGAFPDAWTASVVAAIPAGLDIAAGLHCRLGDIPALAEAAQAGGRRLIDVRHPRRGFDIATPARRGGHRLLTVGTDCCVGKMFTALAIEAEMKTRGMAADFRATGQTGIFIAGSGIAVDAVVADFISGAAEWLSPENDPDHWDLIEGQGSLSHASYAGVTLGLIHGSQPDRMVLCHEPGRSHMRGLPGYPLPSLKESLKMNEAAGSLTNPECRVCGLSLNTSRASDSEAERLLKSAEDEVGLPAVDAYRQGASRLVDAL